MIINNKFYSAIVAFIAHTDYFPNILSILFSMNTLIGH